MAGRFEPRRADDPARLIAAYPLGWLVSGNFNASPLPLLAETGADGAVVSLFGHCARSNPLVADFRADPKGLILFNGPKLEGAGYQRPGSQYHSSQVVKPSPEGKDEALAHARQLIAESASA